MAPHRNPERVLQCLERALATPGLAQDADLPEASASVALVVHMVECEPALLWIERAKNPADPWSGQMGFPGGRAEAGDPSPRHTAERETLEEIGLELWRHGQYVGPLNEVRVMNRLGPAPFKLSPHVYFVEQLPALVPDPREVATTHSVPVRHMVDPAHATSKQVTWKGERFTMAGVRLGERMLWGLSYKVWRDLEVRLGATELLAALRPGERDS